MSTGKRLAKRSILGTRVSAPFDGHYYSGIIQAIKNANPMDNSQEQLLYSVLFDNKINNRKVVLDFMAQDLIGAGFQTISNVALNKGQKVFITYNGREVAGCVDQHNVASDEVVLTVDLSASSPTGQQIQHQTNSHMQVRRRLDECRLSESRKSARLLELDTDYSKLAQDGYRGRTSSLSSTVSSSSVASSYIDVPAQHNGRKRRSTAGNDDVLDDCMAAMVLMSLSCSPQSSLTSQSSTESRIIFQCTWPGCGQQCLTCHLIEQHVRTKHLGRIDLNDPQLDGEEEFYYTEIEVNASPLPSSGAHSASSSPGPQSPADSIDGSCKSESQSPIPSPHNFFSSSAPVWSHLEDHEYLKQPEPMRAQAVSPGNGHMPHDSQGQIKIKLIHPPDVNSNSTSLLSRPINIPGLTAHSPLAGHQYARSAPVALGSPRAHHKFMRVNGNTKAVPLTTTAGPVVAKTGTKRVRGESRKCRKVYGMDNREAWCTQCKWKKACTRFSD